MANEKKKNGLTVTASGYKPSASVQAAQSRLNEVQGQRPAAYQSKYSQQMDDMFSRIQNRKPFQYDLNGDMLYRQYRDQYQNLGRQAMMDTMGQAAGLTGGYGSTYGQNVGQQAYQGYLQQLNDKIPQLYSLALDRYNSEGDDLYRQYGLLSDREATDYGRYRDTVGDWRDDLGFAYQMFGDERSFDYGGYRDAVDDYWRQKNFDYQVSRDQVADSQWERSFAAQQAARAAAQRAAEQKDWEAAYQDLLDKQFFGNENYERVSGTKQNTYEVEGFGTISQKEYDDMLAAGLIDEATVDRYGVMRTRMRKESQNGLPTTGGYLWSLIR